MQHSPLTTFLAIITCIVIGVGIALIDRGLYLGITHLFNTLTR